MEALLNVGCKAAKISYLQQKFILPALAVMPIVTLFYIVGIDVEEYNND